jgi:hypothetical protein
VYAEPYKSKQFPSNEILLKSYNSFHSSPIGDPEKPVGLEIIGKYQSKIGWYHVYMKYKNTRTKDKGEKKFGKAFKLLKLDTDLWVIVFKEHAEKILKK